MADVLIVGDGPGGLTAALFLAKNGLDVVVVGRDETPMHKAMLLNFPGIPRITGSDFQDTVRRQATDFGAKLVSAGVTGLRRDGETFTATAEDGSEHTGRYLVLGVGSRRDLADDLGLARAEDGTVEVDNDSRASVANIYALGWTTKRHKTQAVIAAGDGAACALDILSTEKGQPFHDFDVVETK